MHYNQIFMNTLLHMQDGNTLKSYELNIGDVLSNLTYVGPHGEDTTIKSAKILDFIVSDARANKSNDSASPRIDGVSLNDAIDKSRDTYSPRELYDVAGILVTDTESTKPLGKFEQSTILSISIDKIKSIDSVTASRITVYPSDEGTPIADAIAKMTDGQDIYLSSGIYTEELTITKAVNIYGSGNARTILKGKISINLSTPGIVKFSDVSISKELEATHGIIEIDSTNSGTTLILERVRVRGENASSAEGSTLILKKPASSLTSTVIRLVGTSLTVLDGTSKNKVYAISIGDDSGIDKGTTTLIFECSDISAKNDAIHCTARAACKILGLGSDVSGLRTMYMTRSGETDSLGSFDPMFDVGSVVKFDHCTLMSNNDTTDTITGNVELDHSKLASVFIKQCKMISGRGDNADSGVKYAPSYAVYVSDDSECVDCSVSLDDVTMEFVSPQSTVACKIKEGNRLTHFASQVSSRDIGSYLYSRAMRIQ